ADIDGQLLLAVGSAPPTPTLTRTVVPLLAQPIAASEPTIPITTATTTIRANFNATLPTNGDQPVVSRALGYVNRLTSRSPRTPGVFPVRSSRVLLCVA